MVEQQLRLLACFGVIISFYWQQKGALSNANFLDGNNFRWTGDDNLKKCRGSNGELPFHYGQGFGGVDTWPTCFKDCAGKYQSPVNVDTSKLKNKSYTPLYWKFYHDMPLEVTLVNSGHTVVLRARFEPNKKPYIKHGPLKRCYNLEQVHFHWGYSDNMGSEHTINGRSYPMEMHVVHTARDLTVQQAMYEPNGIAVISYMLEFEDECSSTPMEIIKEHLNELKDDEHDRKTIPIFRMSELFYLFEKDYVYYRGSLTTPPCTENVQWIIAPHSLRVTHSQLEEFRKVFADNLKMRNNYRPLQPLNGRILTLDIMYPQ